MSIEQSAGEFGVAVIGGGAAGLSAAVARPASVAR